MKTIQRIMSSLLVAACATPINAGDIAVRINVGTNDHRVTFTVVVENSTDRAINLMPTLSKGTTNWTSLTLLWRVNEEAVEFLPKSAHLMYPPFDMKVLPPYSTNAVARVENNELFVVTQTTNRHTREVRAAIATSGTYRIHVETIGDWGGHPKKSATTTIDIEKSPTSTSPLRR